MPTKSSEARTGNARARAEATFRKEERARDGAKAMVEYQTNSRVVRERMARLKALRLAKEATDKTTNGATMDALNVQASGTVSVKKTASKKTKGE